MYEISLRKRSIYKWKDSFETKTIENLGQWLIQRMPEWVPPGSVAIRIRPDDTPVWQEDVIIFGRDQVLEMPRPDQDVPDYLADEVVESKRQYYDFHYDDWTDDRLYYDDEDAVDGVKFRDKRRGLNKVVRRDTEDVIWTPDKEEETE